MEHIDNYHGDYGADSHSSLQLFRASRRAYHCIRIARTMEPQPPSAAMEFGSLFHAVMEGNFQDRYTIGQKFDRRTKAGKAASEEFAAANNGKIIVDADDYQLAMAMREGVLENPDAESIVTRAGEVEKRFDWTIEEMPVKCRVDKAIDYGGTILIVDYKTTEDVSADGFARTCANFGYHRQQALYTDIIGSSGAEVVFVFVAVSKKPPHESACYCLGAEAVSLGRRENFETLRAIKKCHETGDWSGEFSRGIHTIELPRWAYKFGA